MKHKFLIAGTLIILAFMGLALSRQLPNQAQTLPPATATPSPTSSSTPGDGDAAIPENQLSLLQLRTKQFDGRELTLGPVLDQNEQYTRYYITYKSGDLTISGIMNIPRGEGPFPVLILNHGYIDPAVYTNGRGLKREQDYLARRGYAVLHPDYRNHANSDKDPNNDINFRMGYVDDVINAVYAVKQSNLPSLDKDRIGMLGHSMGGGIALSVMVAKPDLVKAYVLFAPVSGDVRENFNRWMTSRPEVAERIVQVFGRPEDNQKTWDAISPITYIAEVQSPIMIHHGNADASVPLAWSERLHNTLQQNGKQTVFYTYSGEAHEFINDWPSVMTRTVDFFNQHIKS